VYDCPHGESEGGTKTACQDRSIGTFLPIRALARGDRSGRRTRTGPNEHRHAERPAADRDLANGLSREALFTHVGTDHDLIPCEVRQATGRPDARPVLDLELIVEVGPKRKIRKKACVNTARRRRDGLAIP
jgi:hypothetical protein